MPITVTYAETRTSTITVTAGQARELLLAAGRPAAADLSDADLAAVMQDELAAVGSDLPEQLEPRVDEMAEISHREWDVTVG
jgi:hypothetical protein